MLHSRWLHTLDRFADSTALFEGGRRWTFADLARELALCRVATSPVTASGTASEIVLAVLQGWRDRQPIVPLEKGSALPPLPSAIPEKAAHLKLTPGIAGNPRAVLFSAAQIGADADRIAAAMDLTPEVPNLAAISLTHSYGFSSIVLPLLLHGVPVHAVDVPFPKVIADAFALHDSVVLQAVPSMWRAWHRSGVLDSAKIARAVSAGAPLSLELERAVFAQSGLKLHNFYGASECGGISYDASLVPRDCASLLGTTLPGVEVTVHPSGRLMVESDSVAMGYDTTRDGEILGQRRFLTQDFGRVTGGHVHLDGSGAESINVAGRKIGPAKIEAALLASGVVERARVYGIPSPDPERVEEIVAMVRLKSGTLEQLRQQMTETLAGWELPRHWEVPPDDARWSLSRAELKASPRPR